MEAAFRLGKYEEGVIRAIEQVSELLQRHFPAQQERRDELPSKPAVL